MPFDYLQKFCNPAAYLWCARCHKYVYAKDTLGRLRATCPICKSPLTYKSKPERIEK